MRAYAANVVPLARAFEPVAGVLERIGLSPAWLIRRTAALAAWQAVSDRGGLAAYAIAVWLAAWGIERETDAEWVDGRTRRRPRPFLDTPSPDCRRRRR